MRSKLFSIIISALATIFMLFIDADTNAIFNIIVVFVITAIDCIYIYVAHHIDIEKRPERARTVWIIGIALIIISALLTVIEGIPLIKERGFVGGVFRVSRRPGAYCEIILCVILIFQIYKTMRVFSNSLKVKNTTDWFYENENNQEEK